MKMKMKSSSSAGVKAQDPAVHGEAKFSAQNSLMSDVMAKVDSDAYSQVFHAAKGVAMATSGAQGANSSIVPASSPAKDLKDV